MNPRIPNAMEESFTADATDRKRYLSLEDSALIDIEAARILCSMTVRLVYAISPILAMFARMSNRNLLTLAELTMLALLDRIEATNLLGLAVGPIAPVDFRIAVKIRTEFADITSEAELDLLKIAFRIGFAMEEIPAPFCLKTMTERRAEPAV